MKEKIWGDKAFRKKLFALVVPIALQQFALALASALDATTLKLISQEKMSAVALATQVTFVFNLFLAAMTIGFSTLAAQYWGRGDVETVEKIFGYVMRLTVGIAVAFFLTTLLFPAGCMRILTNEPVLISGGAEYLRFVAPSYLLTGFGQIELCALKNSGRAKAAGIVGALCTAGDAVANVLLVLGLFGLPRMEIKGAALSTTVASALQAIWLAIGERRGVRLRSRYFFRLEREMRGRFWRYTLPVLGNELVWGVGVATYSVIMGRLGEEAVAANSVANLVKNLCVCVCVGIGNGGSVLVGNELGAGNLVEAKKYGDALCRLSVLFGVASGALLSALSPWICSFAGLSPLASEYLRGMLWICAYYLVGKSVNCTAIAGIFCAGGDSKFGFWCDVAVTWGIVLPLGFLSAFVWELSVLAVYFFVCLDEMIKLPAVYIRYKKYKWVKDLTQKGESL